MLTTKCYIIKGIIRRISLGDIAENIDLMIIYKKQSNWDAIFNYPYTATSNGQSER